MTLCLYKILLKVWQFFKMLNRITIYSTPSYIPKIPENPCPHKNLYMYEDDVFKPIILYK
jgi:hypothetical protein